MAETPARYCSNCGHELSLDDRFCPGCGRAAHEVAQVPTPEADVDVPPPPRQAAQAADGQPPRAPHVGRWSNEPGELGCFRPGCLWAVGILIVVLATINYIGDLAEESASDPPPSVSSYKTVHDASGTLEMEVPSGWGDIDGRPREFDQGALAGKTVYAIVASPDIRAYRDTWSEPGVFLYAYAPETSQAFDEENFLDKWSNRMGFAQDCEYAGEGDYDNGTYAGKLATYENCGGSTRVVVVAATAEDESHRALVEVQLDSGSDPKIEDRILDSFGVVNPDRAEEEQGS